MGRENRKHFRINTDIEMSWSSASQQQQPAPQGHLEFVGATINQLIAEVNHSNPTISRLAGLLNTKLDLIADQLAGCSMPRVSQRVNISGGGIAFAAASAITIGEAVVIKMILPISHELLTFNATVVGCHARGQKSGVFTLRCQFEEGQDAACESIIHFVNATQTQMLQRRRMTAISTDDTIFRQAAN